MELKKITIKNFRSIANETIHINKNCMVLLGKNGAGKSNILKAIAVLFSAASATLKDKRKGTDEETHICGIYEANDATIEAIASFLVNIVDLSKVSFTNGKSINDFIKTVCREVSLNIVIKNNATNQISLALCPDFIFEGKIEPIKLKPNNNMVATTSITDINSLRKVVGEIIRTKFIHKCILWKNNNMLPDEVDIKEFSSKPENFPILAGLFVASGKNDVKSEWQKAIQQNGDCVSLLKSVSKWTTSEIRKIWDDFSDTSIEFHCYDSKIVMKVCNNETYSLEERSDGFKKFIKILLTISVGIAAKHLDERYIIIIDEPEQSLYPLSAKCLRDELIKLGERNLIFYATHSQYMIDSNCIERHLIVEKGNDITTVQKCTLNAPFYENELLLRAIGTSIFECIKGKNIIFEGWLDKQLFVKYQDSHGLQDSFSDIGIVYLGGISGVSSLVQLLILANKKFIIISDSDNPSQQAHKKFTNEYSEYSRYWLEYNDAVPTIVTMEDFFTTVFISETLKKMELSSFSYDTEKSAIDNIRRAAQLLDKASMDEKAQKIKKNLMMSCTENSIKPEYKTLVDKVQQLLKDEHHATRA